MPRSKNTLDIDAERLARLPALAEEMHRALEAVQFDLRMRAEVRQETYNLVNVVLSKANGFG
jgi:hypothetical protein